MAVIMHDFRLYSRTEHVIHNFVIYRISKLRPVLTFKPKKKFNLESFYHYCQYDKAFIKKCSWLIFKDFFWRETIPMILL